jgi:chromosome segregation protein
MNEHLEELLSIGAADEKERLKSSQRIMWLGTEIERLHKNIELKKEQHNKNEEATKEQQEYLSKSKDSVGDEKEALDGLRQKLNQEMAKQDEEKKKLGSMQELISTSQNRQMELIDKKHAHQVKLERANLEIESMQNRIWDYYELTYQGTLEFKNDELDLTGADEAIAKMRRQIKAMGTVNVNAVQDYAELNERYTEHKSQHDDLIKAEKDLLGVIDGLNKQMREKFRREFDILNEYFTENFTKLFGGGRAQLTLEDEDDVLKSGIIIEAQPPGKKLQMLSLLSGGEKALTAAAILFAMLKHRPSPFCLLDEIESALDDANLYHLADFLKEYSKETQFVVITHRRPTMESCDVLYGVTMEERGVSKMISVKIADYA